ncbi:MAG: glucokinase [Marinilabiliales bacterium]|nr:MAG: glucokinase [Marinilabiliales bacterium]
MKEVAIGIDIGGTFTTYGIVDKSGKVIVKDAISTPKHGNIDEYIGQLAGVITELINSVKILSSDVIVKGIGIGAPNGNYYHGTIEHAPNLSFSGIIPFTHFLKAHFPDLKHIILTNDANAAAIGEMIYGGAKNMNNFMMVTLGTGVGSGIVVNGDLVYGHDGFAGEFGHTVILPGGRACGCGGFGHIEAYCSAPGIKRTAFGVLLNTNNTESPLANISYNELTSKMIYEAAMEGDPVAKETFMLTGKYLGIALADAVHYLSPEAIFLFGGPVNAGDMLFNPLRDSFEENLMKVFRNKIQILASEIPSGDAAIIGASALVWKEVL